MQQQGLIALYAVPEWGVYPVKVGIAGRGKCGEEREKPGSERKLEGVSVLLHGNAHPLAGRQKSGLFLLLEVFQPRGVLFVAPVVDAEDIAVGVSKSDLPARHVAWISDRGNVHAIVQQA